MHDTERSAEEKPNRERFTATVREYAVERRAKLEEVVFTHDEGVMKLIKGYVAEYGEALRACVDKVARAV